MEMTRQKSFAEQVAAIPGGEKIGECIQCGVCSGSCTTATRWEHTPRKIIAMVRAGMKEEVLRSSSIWFCVSCYLCSVRCPRNIRPADLIHALEVLATSEGYKPPSRTPAMYRSFVDSVRANGRAWELGLMMRYYLRTNPFRALKAMPVAISLLSHRRLPLLPKARNQAVDSILKRVKVSGGGA